MAEILIYDEIGPEWLGMVNAKSIKEQLPAANEPLTVRINSPGGDLVEAQAVYNLIAGHAGETTVKVDGLAASAASYIMLAGDKIEIAENAMVMIHQPYTVAIGNAGQLRDRAGVLDKFEDVLLDGYTARGKKTRDEFAAAVKAETWFSAAAAVEWGLADSIGQPLKVAACVAPGRYRNAPEALLNPHAAEQARQRRMEALKNRLRMLKARGV